MCGQICLKLLLETNVDDDEGAESDKKGKKKKGRKHKKKKKQLRKIGGKYAERYQLSLISPSVVPNYFPTLRIMEYNITGIEDTPVWRDSYDLANPSSPLALPEEDTHDYENPEEILVEILKKKKKGKDSKGPRRPPKDHDLIVPLDPPKSSLPGPAYAPQVLTLTGYTQYYANLTHINDDIPDNDAAGLGGFGGFLDINKWRKGKHDHKEPKHGKPNPRDFQYEIEYSTFTDKAYKLPDLTVKSFLRLAYKMGQKDVGSKSEAYDEDVDEDSGIDEVADDAPEAMSKKNKGKKDKKKKEKNKTWLTFLSRAFVGTVPKEELEKM
jgi:endopolyphosphatase